MGRAQQYEAAAKQNQLAVESATKKKGEFEEKREQLVKKREEAQQKLKAVRAEIQKLENEEPNRTSDTKAELAQKKLEQAELEKKIYELTRGRDGWFGQPVDGINDLSKKVDAMEAEIVSNNEAYVKNTAAAQVARSGAGSNGGGGSGGGGNGNGGGAGGGGSDGGLNPAALAAMSQLGQGQQGGGSDGNSNSNASSGNSFDPSSIKPMDPIPVEPFDHLQLADLKISPREASDLSALTASTPSSSEADVITPAIDPAVLKAYSDLTNADTQVAAVEDISGSGQTIPGVREDSGEGLGTSRVLSPIKPSFGREVSGLAAYGGQPTPNNRLGASVANLSARGATDMHPEEETSSSKLLEKIRKVPSDSGSAVASATGGTPEGGEGGDVDFGGLFGASSAVSSEYATGPAQLSVTVSSYMGIQNRVVAGSTRGVHLRIDKKKGALTNQRTLLKSKRGGL